MAGPNKMAGDRTVPTVAGPQPGKVFRLLSRFRNPDAREGMIAVFDQAVVSGVNFLTAIILARYMPQQSYGYYVLLFAVLLFVNGLQTALITAPMMVLVPRYAADELDGYFSILWFMQTIGCVLTTVVVLIGMPLGQSLWPGFASETALLPLLLVVLTYLGQEFVRRALFARRDALGGTIVDLISYGCQVSMLLVLIAQHRLTLTSTLWTIGVTSLASCAWGIVRLRPRPHGVSGAQLGTAWSRHWNQGKWLVGGHVAQWTSMQLYFFVVALVLSPAATGMLAASRNLLGVTHLFLLGLENIVPSMATRRLLEEGVAGLADWMRRFRWLIAGSIGLYCLVIGVFAGPLMPLIFGSQYAGTGLVVGLIAVSYFINAYARPTMIGLRAMERNRWVFYGFLTSSLVALVLSFPLVRLGGLLGAALGMILTPLILLAVLTWGYRSEVRGFVASERQSSIHRTIHDS